MTIEVGIFEAKTRLSELIDQVANERREIVITKRGKPVARLLPTQSDDSSVDVALGRLLAARTASEAGTESLRELIDHGRTR